MRRTALALLLLTGVPTAATLGPSAASARSAERPSLAPARAAFLRLSGADRMGLHLMLIATGDFNAMVSDMFGTRLYDAIARFQDREGLRPTGIADPETMARLDDKGGSILRSWGMHLVDHPFARASLSVPGTFGLVGAPTPRGLAFDNARRSMSLDFAFFPESEASLVEIFGRLSAPLPNRRIDMAVIRPGFFAVAGGGKDYGTYSRYIPVAGGIVGFTLTWNTNALPNANRVAVVMANALLPTRSGDKEVAAAPRVAPAPPAVPPRALPPPRQASLEAPPPAVPAPVTVSGSAFFVSADGDLLTNDHVVKGCTAATIPGRGPARIVARDARNDLALLRLDTRPAAPMRPATFRGAPPELGEAAYVLGFPYAGALDNGVNFTNGMISALAGIDNDTTRFQMTAPVQPGSSGGPVLDAWGGLSGVTVSRLNDVAVLEATRSVPQNVNFGIKAEVAASFLRVNGVEPRSAIHAAPLSPTQIAALGKGFTAQVTCERVGE